MQCRAGFSAGLVVDRRSRPSTIGERTLATA
jgi:hypothetical protein